MDGSYLRLPSGRLRTPWRLLLAAALFFVVSLAGAAVFFALDSLFLSAEGPLETIGYGIASGLSIALGVAVAAELLDRRSFEGLGLAFGPAWWRDLAVGLALGAGLIAGMYLVGAALGVYRPRFAPAAPDPLSLLVGFALVTGFMIVVGFYEELLFRGYLMTNVAEGLTIALDRRTALLGAVALSSLAFAALHGLNPNMTWLGIATIAVAGVALGLGYALTGRLGLPIGFHITWNLAHFVFGLPVSGLELGVRLFETELVGSQLVHGGEVGPEGGILGFLTAVAGCLAVIAYSRWAGEGLQVDLAGRPADGDRRFDGEA